MAKKLRKERVIKILAKKAGFIVARIRGPGPGRWELLEPDDTYSGYLDKRGAQDALLKKCRNFLYSRDALGAVFKNLTAEEWERFGEAIAVNVCEAGGPNDWQIIKAIFTLTPEQIAYAMAEAITPKKQIEKRKKV